jgi:hypothetical protein
VAPSPKSTQFLAPGLESSIEPLPFSPPSHSLLPQTTIYQAQINSTVWNRLSQDIAEMSRMNAGTTFSCHGNNGTDGLTLGYPRKPGRRALNIVSIVSSLALTFSTYLVFPLLRRSIATAKFSEELKRVWD